MPVKLKTFYLLDLDRTLLDTSRNASFMIEIIRDFSPEIAAKLETQNKAYEAMGESLSILEFIKQELTAAELQDIKNRYLTSVAAEDFLNAGAKELIAALEDKADIGCGVLSYGSEEGQLLKVKGNKLDTMPALVTGERDKGKLIGSWQQPDGSFRLPEEYREVAETAQSIVLVDDKAFSFESLPSNSRGYWVRVPGGLYQEGNIPASVVVVASLHEIIGKENL